MKNHRTESGQKIADHTVFNLLEIISCVPDTFCTSCVKSVQFALISAQSYPTST